MEFVEKWWNQLKLAYLLYNTELIVLDCWEWDGTYYPKKRHQTTWSLISVFIRTLRGRHLCVIEWICIRICCIFWKFYIEAFEIFRALKCKDSSRKFVCLPPPKMVEELTTPENGRGAPMISHMFFTDDSYFYCNSTNEETFNVLKLLKTFEHASDQQS